jgi:hypothetical protein
VAGAGSTLRAILGDTAAESAIGVRLPLLPPLDKLFGRGLRRGAVVAVDGDAARMSLAMALMAGVSGDGGWCGVVGVPSFGCVAASELGVRLDRLAMVPQPGPVWAEAMAAMLPGMDVLLVQPPGLVPGRLARRLAARARQARCTVLTLGPVWEGADVRISAVHQEWLGVGAGSGRLRSRRVRVAVSNRPGSELDVWLPAEGGGVAEVELTVQPPLSIVDRRVAAGAVDLDEAV